MLKDKKVLVLTQKKMEDLHADVYGAAIYARMMGADFFCKADDNGLVKEIYSTYAELYNYPPLTKRTVGDFLYWYDIKNTRVIVYDQCWGEETADVYIGETDHGFFNGMCDYAQHIHYDFDRDAMVFTV